VSRERSWSPTAVRAGEPKHTSKENGKPTTLAPKDLIQLYRGWARKRKKKKILVDYGIPKRLRGNHTTYGELMYSEGGTGGSSKIKREGEPRRRGFRANFRQEGYCS